MTTISATDARSKLYKLLDQARETSEPILITGERGNGVLISEDDWRSIQETLYLLSIPGMRESIREGMATPVEETSEQPGWRVGGGSSTRNKPKKTQERSPAPASKRRHRPFSTSSPKIPSPRHHPLKS